MPVQDQVTAANRDALTPVVDTGLANTPYEQQALDLSKSLIDKIFGLRPSAEVETEGLDIAEHGERAYHY